MPRIKIGETMTNFAFQTPFKKHLVLKEAVGEQKTAILFLRYYGCTLCQYDMKLLKDHYGEITQEGGRFLVVLQSAPDKVAKDIDENHFPYVIICDPDKILYEALEIIPALSKEELAGGSALAKIAKAKEYFSHGDYEGDELQLPAVVVVNRDLQVLYVHYGTDAADVPSPKELAELLSDNRGGKL